jgi:dolichol kinase
MAAIIGRKYGSVATQIPYTNKKTIQGYMAYTLTSTILQFALYMVIICVYPSGNVLLDNINVRLGILVIVSSVVCGAAELFSGDLDNIVCGFAYIVTDWVLAYV